MSSPTILLLDVFGILDASRSGLINALAFTGCDVVIANFSYTHLSQSTELGETLSSFIEELKIDFDGIISINAVGLCSPIYDAARLRGIPHLAWFIDSPYYFSNLEIPDSISLNVACSNFGDHPKTQGSKWLPFAGVVPQPNTHKAQVPIGFLGTLHHISSYAHISRAGLIGSRTGLLSPGIELRDRMREPAFMLDERWSTKDGTAINTMEYFNFQSSMHRLEILSFFSHLNIEIQGPESWIPELWTSAPHLLPRFSVNFIVGPAQMREYLSRYTICLNIFHIQNMNGGPNFRSFDAASNFVPCLSQHNMDCARMFPDGEAALYFKNSDDALYLYRQLTSSKRLRNTITRTAANIVLDGNTFSHRAQYFVKSLALRPSCSSGRGKVRLLRWQDGWSECPDDGGTKLNDKSKIFIDGHASLPIDRLRKIINRIGRGRL